MRIVTNLLIVFVLSLCTSSYLLAQDIPADRFLADVSAHPVGDEAEQKQFLEASQSLGNAPAAEVKRELPSILQYALAGNLERTRVYSVVFLNAIAMRPGGAALLYPSSEEISSLILDSDPGIQRGAVSVAFWAGPNQPRYLSAFEVAIERAQTPQDIDVQIVSFLARTGSSDSDSLKAALDFMHRDDLTVLTRRQLVHFLGNLPELPDEINKVLVKELDDPDPGVRAAAVAAFSDSASTAYHALAKNRVENMANDAQENPEVRKLAQEAIAGKTNLSPNINVPPVPKDLPPLPAVQPMDH
jgi:hypothetical protein